MTGEHSKVESVSTDQHLSCPFCGDRDIRVHHRGHPGTDGWCIECHSCSCELTGFASREDAWENWNKRVPAAPDMLAALKRLAHAYVNTMESGRDRIVALGGDCDPVDVMERGDPYLRLAKDTIAKAEGRS